MCEWIVDNAVGLIQIIIGIIALFLAVKAYFRILDQIKISNKQEKDSQALRRFEIKQSVFKTKMDYLILSMEIQQNLPCAYELISEKMYEIHNEGGDVEKYNLIIKLLQNLEDKTKLVDEYYQLIIKFFKKDDFDLKALEDLYLKYVIQVNELIVIKFTINDIYKEIS